MSDQTKTSPAPPPSLQGTVCCAPAVQASCCEPSEKARCCTDVPPAEGCGCQ